MGYVPGGITFAVPLDFQSMDVPRIYRLSGVLMLGGTADFTLQLRQFGRDEMTYEQFAARIRREPSARVETRMDGDREILCYRNTGATANSELYGIVITGLDVLLYKISFFTGDSNAYGPDAPVWSVAEAIAQTVRCQDFSEWGIPTGEEAK